MSLPPLPKMPRQFLCTKCGSNTCDGSIDADHPPCSKCGYLGFASDVGHTAEQMQAYGQACREAALEEAVSAIEDTNARRIVYLPDAIEIIRNLK